MSRFNCGVKTAVALIAFAVWLSPGGDAETFKPACPKPHLPSTKATLMDKSKCGLEGIGDAGEALQNAAKNNFCPQTQNPATIDFEQLAALQKEVEKDETIVFGPKGPALDRAPLRKLGEGNLVQLRAFVMHAMQEGAEKVNCQEEVPTTKDYHDIHISLVPDVKLTDATAQEEIAANECQGVVAEMSPHFRPALWTAGNINKASASKLAVRVTGQLFFDSSHVPCKEGAPVGSNPKRFSLWEIHPIYAFEVCTDHCDGDGTWISLEKWLSTKK